jgi:hypothetical protein
LYICTGEDFERERGRRGEPHVPPQKTYKNLVIKMQQNRKRGTPLDFFTTPCTPSKEFQNDFAFIIEKYILSPHLTTNFFQQ